MANIRYTRSDGKRNSRQKPTEDVLITFVVLVCLGYSTYQTAYGFEKTTGGLTSSIVLSLVISAAMVLSIMRIRTLTNYRRYGMAAVIFLLYLFFMFFSFSANFNKFYSQSVSTTLLEDEYKSMAVRVDSINQSVLLKIEKEFDDSEFINTIQGLKASLHTQITTSGAQGIGRRARGIIQKLENELGVPLTEPLGTPENVAREFDQQIDNILSGQLKVRRSSSSGKYKSLLNKASLYISEVDSIVAFNNDNLLLEKKIGEGASIFNQIGNFNSSLFQESSNLPLMKNIHRDIGTIEHSYRIALDPNKVDRVARNKAILLSLLLDLSAPLLVFILAIAGRNNMNNNRKNEFRSQSFPTNSKRIDKSDRDSSFEDELEKLAKRGLK